MGLEIWVLRKGDMPNQPLESWRMHVLEHGVQGCFSLLKIDATSYIDMYIYIYTCLYMYTHSGKDEGLAT